jgi:hypothetical protein
VELKSDGETQPLRNVPVEALADSTPVLRVTALPPANKRPTVAKVLSEMTR